MAAIKSSCAPHPAVFNRVRSSNAFPALRICPRLSDLSTSVNSRCCSTSACESDIFDSEESPHDVGSLPFPPWGLAKQNEILQYSQPRDYRFHLGPAVHMPSALY